MNENYDVPKIVVSLHIFIFSLLFYVGAGTNIQTKLIKIGFRTLILLSC